MFKEEFPEKYGEMLANMKIEADNVGHRWGGIFNVACPSPNRPPVAGVRAAVYTVILTGSGGQDEGLQLRHVVLWAQRVLQRLSTKFAGLFLVKVGYVRATSDLPQPWHRDLPLELQNVGVEHAFFCFRPVNLDCPMDRRPREHVCVRSGSGVPYPWQEVSMSMLAGDLWILSSYVIHHVGAVPRDAPAGSTRIIAFAAIATRCVDYETTVPIIPPPWAEGPAPQPSPPSPKAARCTAAPCNRVLKADPPAKCFASEERPPCAVHVGQLYEDCQRDSGDPAVEAAPGPVVEATPGPAVKAVAMSAEGAQEVYEDLGTQKIVEEDLCRFAALVMMPLNQTVLYTTHRPGPLATEISAGLVINASAQPYAPEDCPLGPFVHKEEELEAPTPSKFPVIATQPGILMVVHEGQVGGMAGVEDTVDPRVAQVLRWDVVGTHPRVVDTSVLVQSGLVVAKPERPKECWCPCPQV